jgi:predicted NBD/HSP70 family sugar kinase
MRWMTEPAGQHTLRRHNAALVLRTVLDSPGVSRAAIAARTGLAKATVSSLVDRLIAVDLVAETGLVVRQGRGRRSTGLAPSPTGPHGLGVEIGVDYLATCLVDLAGAVHEHTVRAGDNRDRPPARTLDAAVRAINTALRAAGVLGVPVGGIGIAVPGLVESGTGRLRVAPNLGWRDLDIGAAVRARVDVPVLVGNEADLAAAAHLRHAVDGPRDFVMVTGEIGIGAGLVVAGRPFPGVGGFSGEIGHVTVDPAGPACACGSRGCLEALAGLDRIMREAGVPQADRRPPAQTLDTLVGLLHQAEPAALAAVRAAGRWLGVALASVINVVDVPCVVLGGTYAALAPWLREPLAAELEGRVISASWSPVRIDSSTLGGAAAVRGAAWAAVRAVVDDPDGYDRATA